jgi:hypothetical protein
MSHVYSPKNYYENLKCMLCDELCNEPRIVNCCERLCCKLCINEHISKYPMCPICKAYKPNIQIPNRFIIRLFYNLKVRCQYTRNGCKDIFSYYAIQDHERKCKYNDTKYTKCENCNCDINIANLANQDCVKHLSHMMLY